jgi:hypothetical protein
MFRREFLSFAASSVATASPESAPPPTLAALISQIETAAWEEIPGVTSIKIEHNLENKEMPLMILVFRTN